MKTEGEASIIVPNAGEMSEGLNIRFVERIMEIPVINSAKEFGVGTYNNIKQLNILANYALTAAEQTVLHITDSAQPILGTIKPHAHFVDSLACRGLDVVQEKAPFILHTPDQLIEDARKIYASTIQSGYQKLNQIKASGTQTLSSMENYGFEKADEYLQKMDNLVDVYIPPVEGLKEDPNVCKSLPERVRKFSSKVGFRVYGHGMKQLIAVQRLSQDSISKLSTTFELLQQLKENYSNTDVLKQINDVKGKATWLWEELNKPEETDITDKSMQQKLLSTARRITFAVVCAYNVSTAPISYASPAYREGLNTASRYAAELFYQINKVTHAGEITVSLLDVAQKKLLSFQNSILNLRKMEIELEIFDLNYSSESETSEDLTKPCLKDEEKESSKLNENSELVESSQHKEKQGLKDEENAGAK